MFSAQRSVIRIGQPFATHDAPDDISSKTPSHEEAGLTGLFLGGGSHLPKTPSPEFVGALEFGVSQAAHHGVGHVVGQLVLGQFGRIVQL